MDLGLKNQTALVTGGARGLGRAICLALASEGARVAVNYRRSREQAEQVADDCRRLGAADVRIVGADVCQADQVAALFGELQDAWGELDMVVNNAGVWPTAAVHEMSESDWDFTFDVNLKSVFLTCRQAVQRWRQAEHAGSIVNISSAVAFLGSSSGHAHYAAAKAAVVNFTVSLARESAPHQIRVNAVAPGMIRTDMTQETLSRNEQAYRDRIPLGRIGRPDEVADVVAFLASPRASYITGATVDVSGGMLMR